jgi:hypothetical protein
MPITASSGLLTSTNKGAVDGGVGERVLVDYKDALGDYKATDLPVIQMFAESMTTDTGGDIDLSFALPSMKMESIDEGSTPAYQHTKMRSERVSVKEYGIAVGVTRRMIEDSRFNEVELALNEARKAVDRHITDHFIKAMFGIQNDVYGTIAIDHSSGDTEAGITTFSTNPTGGFLGDGLSDAAVESGNERVYPYGNASTTLLKRTHYVNDGNAAGSIALADVLDGIERIAQHGFNADTMLISPLHFNALLKLADFTAAFVVGDGASIVGSGDHAKQSNLRGTFVEGTNQTRVVGNLYGLKIVSNPWVPTTKYMITDSTAKPCAYVERRGLTVEEANPGFGIVGSYLSMRYGLKIINALSSVVVTNA